MREWTIWLHKPQTLSATVTVKASSQLEAAERAEDWLNNGQDHSDSDEFVTDHNDDPFPGEDDSVWLTADARDHGEVTS